MNLMPIMMVTLPFWDGQLGVYNGSMYNTESIVLLPRQKIKQETNQWVIAHMKTLKMGTIRMGQNRVNEFADKTVIQQSNSDGLVNSMRWSRPDLYWEITVDRIKKNQMYVKLHKPI